MCMCDILSHILLVHRSCRDVVENQDDNFCATNINNVVGTSARHLLNVDVS